VLSDAAFHSLALYYFPRFGALRTTLRLTRGAIENACRNNRSAMTISLSTLRKIEKGQPVSFQKAIAAFDVVSEEHRTRRPNDPALQEEIEVIPSIYLMPRLKALRSAAALSLADLAQRAETAKETIRDLESGRCVTRATAERIARAVSAVKRDEGPDKSETIVLADPSSKPKAARERVAVGSPADDSRADGRD
jgi:transcriptional regulator with XRE-family HTH domain